MRPGLSNEGYTNNQLAEANRLTPLENPLDQDKENAELDDHQYAFQFGK